MSAVDATLRARLSEFVQQLRRAGVRISVAETLDAMEAVAVLGIEPATLRESLSATLVKDELDRPVFERTFDAYFAAPAPPTRPGRGRGPGPSGGDASHRGGGRAGGSSAPAGGKPPPEAEPAECPRAKPARPPQEPPREASRRAGERREEARPRDEKRSADAERRAGAPREAGREERRGPSVPRRPDPRELVRRPLAELEPDDLDAARELAREIGRRFAARESRRMRRMRSGRIDVRRTIRASIGRGGAMFRLERRGRRPGKPALVVLCDVSGSVSRATEVLLAIVGAAEASFRRISRFVYVDHAVPAGFEGGHMAPEGEIDLWARSDLGRVLCELETRHAALFDRSTVLLVLGDARNNRLAHRADALARLRHLGR
ncbi:MAG: VWA domain-containing protein, partial [Alphaproteobacteria bacterium]